MDPGSFILQIWEPLLKQLVLEQESANYKVDEIWSWEAANHGDSCLINADVLGGLCKSVQAPNTALLIHATLSRRLAR